MAYRVEQECATFPFILFEHLHTKLYLRALNTFWSQELCRPGQPPSCATRRGSDGLNSGERPGTERFRRRPWPGDAAAGGPGPGARCVGRQRPGRRRQPVAQGRSAAAGPGPVAQRGALRAPGCGFRRQGAARARPGAWGLRGPGAAVFVPGSGRGRVCGRASLRSGRRRSGDGSILVTNFLPGWGDKTWGKKKKKNLFWIWGSGISYDSSCA